MFDYFFWFAQPSTILSSTDNLIGYFFAALLIIGIVLLILRKFVKHQIYRKIIKNLGNLSLVVGVLGIFWFGLRYENTPIFGRRYWAGMVGVIGLVWLGFILKYLVFRFAKDRKEYEHELVKNKYLGRSR
jgi:hypothetical protein